MWDCHSDGRNLTKWLNLLSIFLDVYELRRNWGSKTNIQQKKISQYPAPLISHLLITQVATKGGYKYCRIESNDSSRLMSIRHTGSRFARHLENIRRVTTKGSWRYCRIDSIRLESNDSSQLMSTRHSGSRFARYLENIPQVVTKGGCRFSRIERIP